MSDKEPKAWTLVATLAVAGLLSGLTIVGAYQITLPQITANKAAALQRAVLTVLPGATSLRRVEASGDALIEAPDGQGLAVYAGLDDANHLVGFAVPAEGPGFQDIIELIYGYDPVSKRIVGMRVLESRETPGLGDKIIKDNRFVSGFDALAPDPSVKLVSNGAKAADNEVDAISGATISSRAVVKIVNDSHTHWQGQLPNTWAPEADHE
ncbi:MAG: electron transport complex protein RnfG [Kiritimatiellia bacterium]|jgi:electron transport complex protein RnfG